MSEATIYCILILLYLQYKNNANANTVNSLEINPLTLKTAMKTNNALELHEFLSELEDLEIQNLFQKVIKITNTNQVEELDKAPRFLQTLVIITFISPHEKMEETLLNKLNEANRNLNKFGKYTGHAMYYQIICTMLDIIIHSDELMGAFEAELQELQTQPNGEKAN